jgi:hypothetical protein
MLYLLDHWALLLLTAIAVGGAAWLLPRLARAARTDIRQRLAIYRDSEC